MSKPFHLRDSSAFELLSLCLPDDMADAFEQMKLCIMRHKAEQWQEITEDHAVQALWELMRLCWQKPIVPERVDTASV
jgi:hypothetical protein